MRGCSCTDLREAIPVHIVHHHRLTVDAGGTGGTTVNINTKVM